MVLYEKNDAQKYMTSAVQVRINGSKGMLVVKPFGRDGDALQEWSGECAITLRESMVKSYKDWKRI